MSKVSLILCATVLFGASWVSGADAPAPKADAPKPNTTCPVMEGEEVEANISVEYKGQKVLLCCKKCVKKWTADPEKYAAKLKDCYGKPTEGGGEKKEKKE